MASTCTSDVGIVISDVGYSCEFVILPVGKYNIIDSCAIARLFASCKDNFKDCRLHNFKTNCFRFKSAIVP